MTLGLFKPGTPRRMPWFEVRMIRAVLDHQGIPHEDGFFAKDLDATPHLTEGWRERVYEKFKDVYPESLLRFYTAHLAWELLHT